MMTSMNRILVGISITPASLEKIKLNPELQQKEMQYVKQWQEKGILESFFITVSKTGAVLIFKNVTEAQARDLIGVLPYFPFMDKIEYLNLDKHF